GRRDRGTHLEPRSARATDNLQRTHRPDRENDVIETVNLGVVRYTEAMTMMDGWVAERRSGLVGDRLFLLSHPPVITFGRNTRPEELPDERCGIDLVAADRGGYATYHGPGQIIGYLVVDCAGAGPARLIRWVEETLITALDDVGVGGLSTRDAVRRCQPRRCLGGW